MMVLPLRSKQGRMIVTSFLGVICFATASLAHNGVVHKSQEEAVQHQLETAKNTPGFPAVKGGDFDLIDHRGNRRTSKSPEGHYQLLFFGYASCKAICSVALPRMADAVDRLKKLDQTVTPLLVTVDPERDTLRTLGPAVSAIHPDLVGLTGHGAALQQAYDAFQVQKSLVYTHPEEGPIYAHGSFIYLLAPDGSFKTIFPPVLSPSRIAETTLSYIKGEK